MNTRRDQQNDLLKRARAAEEHTGLPNDIRQLLRNMGSEIMMLRAERDTLQRNLDLANDLLSYLDKASRPFGVLSRSFL